MWNVRFFKTGVACGFASWPVWVARSCREITVWLVVLFCPVVLQLAWLFTFWHAWHVCFIWRLAAASHPRDQAVSLCFLAHFWAFNTLSHSLPLQQTHLNTGLLNAEIQANLTWNKANKMVDKIQPYRYHDYGWCRGRYAWRIRNWLNKGRSTKRYSQASSSKELY